MTFLESQDLAEASVEDVCDEGESINCFFRLRDGREIFVDTNWENINAPMFRDFTRPEFQGTTRWNVADPQPVYCQDATGMRCLWWLSRVAITSDVNTLPGGAPHLCPCPSPD